MFGTTKNINYDPNLVHREAYKKKHAWIILPDSTFTKYWNIIIMLLLCYTATFLPISVAFFDVDSPALTNLELFINGLFFIDVYVNFVSAYVDKGTGFIEVNFKKIAMNYLLSWFVLDLTASIPFQLFTA